MLTSVSFSDADSGWVAGTLGSGVYASRAVLLVTSDGGQTWTRAYTSASTGTFIAVDRLDGRRGWAVGTFDGVRNAIMATADGGSTWELQGVAASEVNGIAMVDALHGCVVGNGGAVLGTTGGGASTDTAPPVTSVRGGGDGWRQRWVLRFVASDGVQGSGVARVQSSTAARGRWATGRTRVLTSGDHHEYDGVHKVRYRAVDVAGNIEADRTCIVRIDTHRTPRVESAPRKTANAGATIRLAYRISDREPCAGWAKGRLSVIRETGDGDGVTLVRVVRFPRRHTGVWRAVTLRGGLPAGHYYLCSFSATDSAGNLGLGGWDLAQGEVRRRPVLASTDAPSAVPGRPALVLTGDLRLHLATRSIASRLRSTSVLRRRPRRDADAHRRAALPDRAAAPAGAVGLDARR